MNGEWHGLSPALHWPVLFALSNSKMGSQKVPVTLLIALAMAIFVLPNSGVFAAHNSTVNQPTAHDNKPIDNGGISRFPDRETSTTDEKPGNGNPGDHPGTTHLKKKAEKNEAHSLLCEAGYPCSKDQWCDLRVRRCRPCAELEPWCNDTHTIHDNYTACEQYCYGYQTDKTRECDKQKEEAEERIKNLTYALQNAESVLANKTRQAQEDKQAHLSQMRQLEGQLQEQNVTHQKQTADLKRCEKEKEKSEDHKLGLMTAAALFTVFAVVPTALAIKFKCDLKHLRDRRHGYDVPQRQGKQKAADNNPLISTESKAPVQPDRGDTDFSSQQDTYCLAGNGGRADACLPGDSAFCP